MQRIEVDGTENHVLIDTFTFMIRRIQVLLPYRGSLGSGFVGRP